METAFAQKTVPIYDRTLGIVISLLPCGGLNISRIELNEVVMPEKVANFALLLNLEDSFRKYLNSLRKKVYPPQFWPFGPQHPPSFNPGIRGPLTVNSGQSP